MASHSRKPKWADDPRTVWAHCRRPNCGAKPRIPGRIDPSLCEACEAEYLERGRKFCRGCAHWRPRSLFSPDARRRDGCRTNCKPCEARKARERRAANPEINRAACVRWRAAHTEEARIYRKRRSVLPMVRAMRRRRNVLHYHRHRDQERARVAQWRQANLERARQGDARRYRLRKLQALRGGR
jgi:hypothetical protein